MSTLEGAIPKQGDGIVADHPAFPALALEGRMRIPDAGTRPAGSQGAAGAIPIATYTYKYTFVTRNPITDAILAESLPSIVSLGIGVSGSAKKVDLDSILPAASDAVNARRIYRSVGGGNFLLVGIIRDNVTTTFQDNAAATTGQPQAPAVNNSGQQSLIDVPIGTPAYIGREEGTERFKIDSKGHPQLGGGTLAYPFGFADVLEDISKEVQQGDTYTVTSGRILFITGLYGPKLAAINQAFNINPGGGAVSIAVTATSKSDIAWKLANPILADAGWEVGSNISTGGFTWNFLGFEIPRTGGIVPILLGAVIEGSNDYVVPADKIFVLLGVAALDTVDFGVEDDGGGTPYPKMFTDISMVYDTGATDVDDRGIAENRIRMPMIFPAGAKLAANSLGCTIWGYEVDV